MKSKSAYKKALSKMTGHGLALELIACRFRKDSRQQLNIILNAILEYTHFKSRILFAAKASKRTKLLESIQVAYYKRGMANEPLLHQFLSGIVERPYVGDVEALIHKYALLEKEEPKRVWRTYHCGFCEGKFKVQDYPSLRRCPYCGSTDEWEQVE